MLYVLLLINYLTFGTMLTAKTDRLDVSGYWTGTISRDESGGKRILYSMELEITQRKKDLSGYSIVCFDDGIKKYYAKMAINGKISGTYIQYTETQIIGTDNIPGAEWCLKKADLVFRLKGNTPHLEGIWEGWVVGSKQECVPGRIELTKKPPRV